METVTNTKTEEEIRAEHKAELESLLATHAERAEIRAMGALRKMFEDDLPAKPKLPEPDPHALTIPGDTRIEVRHAADYLYDRMPAEVRKYRNPKIDQDMKRWIRSLVPQYRDPVTTQLVLREYGGVNEDGVQIRGERAVIAEGTPTSGVYAGTGGALIPLPVAASVMLQLHREAKFRHFVTTFTSPTAVLRTSSFSKATAAMVAEGAVAAEGSPAATAIVLTKKKMQVNIYVTIEELEDAAINLVGLLTERAGSALAETEDDQIATSTGTAPQFTSSFDLASITSVAEAVAGTLTFADFLALWFALPQPYRKNSVIFGNSDVMALLSRLAPTGGRQWFVPNIAAAGVVGDPAAAATIGTLFGRPVLEVNTDAGGLYIGDPRYYALLTSPGVSLRVLDQTQAATDSVEFRFTTREDGNIGPVDAFRSMDGLTTVA